MTDTLVRPRAREFEPRADRPEHKGRGYEIAKGQYMIVDDDDELSAIEIESTHTMDIDSFVPRSRIDQLIL